MERPPASWNARLSSQTLRLLFHVTFPPRAAGLLFSHPETFPEPARAFPRLLSGPPDHVLASRYKVGERFGISRFSPSSCEPSPRVRHPMEMETSFNFPLPFCGPRQHLPFLLVSDQVFSYTSRIEFFGSVMTTSLTRRRLLEFSKGKRQRLPSVPKIGPSSEPASPFLVPEREVGEEFPAVPLPRDHPPHTTPHPTPHPL